MDGKTFKETVQEEIDKLRGLSLGGKIHYFGSYYLLPVSLVLILGFFIVCFLVATFAPKKEILVEGLTVNLDITDDGYAFMTDQYLAYMQGNPDTQAVNLTVGRNIPFSSEAENSGSGLRYLMELTKLVDNNRVDYMLLDEEAYYWFAERNGYADLEEIFSAEDLKTYEEYIVMEKPEGSEKAYKVAFELSGTEFAKANFKGVEKMYFVVLSNGKHLENVPSLFAHMMK